MSGGDLEVNLNDLKEDGDCDQALRRPVILETSRQGAQGVVDPRLAGFQHFAFKEYKDTSRSTRTFW